MTEETFVEDLPATQEESQPLNEADISALLHFFRQ